MPTLRDDGAPERFALSLCRERWLEFVALEHATLVPATDFAFCDGASGGELLVRRERPSGAGGGRPLSGGRIPRPARAALLLQAAAASAFFASRGFPLAPADFEDAVWDGEGSAARLWLTRTPASVRAAAVDDASPSPSAPDALRAALRRLFAGESGRISPEAAREIAASLEATDASWKRAEHWVASILRGFPELAAASAGPARERCLGLASDSLRTARERSLAEKARAILRGEAPRIFEAGASSLTPGGALRLTPPPDGPADAARRLRTLAESGETRRRVWIAVEPETWDGVSRTAFEAARLSLGGAVGVIVVPGSLPAPQSPAEWRRAAWVPGGSLAGSVRLYEWLAEAAPAEPLRARVFLRGVLAGPSWAAFAADPTGDGAPAAGARDRTGRRRADVRLARGARLERSGPARRTPARGGTAGRGLARGRALGERVPATPGRGLVSAGGAFVGLRRALTGLAR